MPRMELLRLKAAKRPQRNALKTPKKRERERERERESLVYVGLGSQEGGKGKDGRDRSTE